MAAELPLQPVTEGMGSGFVSSPFISSKSTSPPKDVETSPSKGGLSAEGLRKDSGTADAPGDDIECLRKELAELKRERQVLQSKMEEAQRKAADAEEQLCRLPSKVRKALKSSKTTEFSESLFDSIVPEREVSKEEARQASGIAARSTGPSRQATRTVAPSKSTSMPRAKSKRFTQSFADPTPFMQLSQEEAPTEMAKEEAPEADEGPPLRARALPPKDGGQQDEKKSEVSRVSGREEEQAEVETEAPAPRSESFPAEPEPKHEMEVQAAAAAAAEEESKRLSRPPSRERSLRWLRKRLSHTASLNEEPEQRSQPLLASNILSSKDCVKCDALSQEKKTLQVQLERAKSRCGHLEAEAQEALEKRRALIEKVRLVVQRTALRMDQLQAKYELAMKEASAYRYTIYERALCSRWQSQSTACADLLLWARKHIPYVLSFLTPKRKGLEMRIAALVDKVHELETSESIPPEPPGKAHTTELFPSYVLDMERGVSLAGLPHVFVKYRENIDKPEDDASSARQTVLVPAYFFDEEALVRAREKAEGNRRRLSVAKPAQLFDEAAAERTVARKSAAAASSGEQSRAVPSNLFNEEPMRKAKKKAENLRTEQTTALPASLSKEPSEISHKSTVVVPSDSCGERESENPLQQQATSRQSSLFSRPLLDSCPRQTQEERPQAELTVGPSVEDAGHAFRRTAPVEIPESDSEDIFPEAPQIEGTRAKVHINNFVGTDPNTGAYIWKVRCPTCGIVAPVTATQLRIPSIKRSAP
ncbi:dual-specificity catalytic domain-containing protein [Cyclospora cayetanensis]|uniref:Dual-specificity catalytic domain-containing protein n=1 Tax=Cyclospora cayetanensis TaxID=88456 RepID=A0A1D3CV51_9EIME|nr:dual-specificity catalytic domain-containing protein [Cyclospora cayetanensis]